MPTCLLHFALLLNLAQLLAYEEAIAVSSEGAVLKKAEEDLPIAEFSGLSADETVKKMFAAMNVWDEGQLKVVLRGVDLAAISKAYKGCTLLECNSAFKSGTYAGVFVPCKVKLANGKETKLNVAMRNDNPWNIWTLDGGI